MYIDKWNWDSPEVRGIKSFSVIAGVVYAWLTRPRINMGIPFWEAYAEYARDFGLTVIKVIIATLVLNSGAAFATWLLSKEDIIIKMNKWVFRIILAVLILLILPLVQVGCERGFR